MKNGIAFWNILKKDIKNYYSKTAEYQLGNYISSFLDPYTAYPFSGRKDIRAASRLNFHKCPVRHNLHARRYDYL